MAKLTQQAMAASLKKMLSKKTLDKITVKEIADDCGVKRQTFYYHFKDLHDLLEWTLIQEGEQVIDPNQICETWQDIYFEVFRYIEDNKNFVVNAYISVVKESLERFLYRIVYDMIAKFLHDMGGAEQMEKEDRDFICDFYKFGLAGIILEWVESGMKEDPESLSGRINRLLERHIEADFQLLTKK